MLTPSRLSGPRARHALVAAAMVGAVLAISTGAAGAASTSPDPSASIDTERTTTVERGSITQQTSWDGVLTYAGTSTVTWSTGDNSALPQDGTGNGTGTSGAYPVASGVTPGGAAAGGGGWPGTGTPSDGPSDGPGDGGPSPSASPSPDPSSSPTPSASPSPDPSASPTPSPTPSASPSPEPTASLQLSVGGARRGLFAAATPSIPDGSSGGSSDVVTWLADPASTVVSGGELFRVNDQPVVLLQTTVAIYRDLTVGDDGADVQAIEQALAALGFDDGGVMTVDTAYTSATARAVEDFQASVGAEATGDIDPTFFITNDGPTIITEVMVSVGDKLSDGHEVMAVSDLDRVVEFSIDPSQKSSLAIGSTVTVSLPDRSSVEAAVGTIDTALQEDGTYGVVALLPDIDVRGDKWTVTVRSTTDIATDALLVDPEAILLTDTLGSAVRVLRNGDVDLVPVTVLGTASQRTAVLASELSVGDSLLY